MGKNKHYLKIRKRTQKKKKILIPKLTKFKNLQKCKQKLIEYKKSSTNLRYGQYGLKLLKGGRLTTKQLEVIRQKISKRLKKKDQLWIRGNTDYPLTFKSKGLRMGKGKGDIKCWVLRVKTGDVLFEISIMRPKRALLVLKPVLKQFSLPVVIINRKNFFEEKKSKWEI